MLKKIASIVFLVIIIVVIYGISNAKEENLIYYKSNGGSIALKKECVNSVVLRKNQEKKQSASVFFDIKQSNSCSTAINSFFNGNIGSSITATFRNNELITANVVSEIKTENGLSQYVGNEKLAMDIVISYGG